ncbi:hypothetical protein MMC18_004231 [Xylographa bjoerkii]|nr:hypothetical protein [Xylographa bjoerkii]
MSYYIGDSTSSIPSQGSRLLFNSTTFTPNKPYPINNNKLSQPLSFQAATQLSFYSPTHRMSYSIVAGVCHHHIRYDTRLPYPQSGSNQDFAVSYCSACLRSQAVAREHSDAADDYHSYSDYDRYDPERRDARRRYDTARIDMAHYQYEREDANRNATASRPSHLRPIPLTQEERDFIRGPSARIETSAYHTSEDSYRSNSEYSRRDTGYSPGRYADASGQGYYNTSDPYRESRSSGRGDSNRRRREGTPYPDRSSAYEDDERQAEEEEEQIRRIKDQLHRYRDV